MKIVGIFETKIPHFEQFAEFEAVEGWGC